MESCQDQSDNVQSQTPSQEDVSKSADCDTVIMKDETFLNYQNSGYNRNSTLVAKYVNRIIEDFPTPSERYYDIRLMSSENRRSYFGEVGDQCIMFHSNRICLLTLAPTHPVILNDKQIENIDYTFEGFEKIDRLSSQPQGKSKKGSQKLGKNSPICSITCCDGSKYIITAGLASKLIEINSLIISNPNLIKERPLSTGFIAIIQPSDWKRMAEVRDSLPKLGLVPKPNEFNS